MGKFKKQHRVGRSTGILSSPNFYIGVANAVCVVGVLARKRLKGSNRTASSGSPSLPARRKPAVPGGPKTETAAQEQEDPNSFRIQASPDRVPATVDRGAATAAAPGLPAPRAPTPVLTELEPQADAGALAETEEIAPLRETLALERTAVLTPRSPIPALAELQPQTDGVLEFADDANGDFVLDVDGNHRAPAPAPAIEPRPTATLATTLATALVATLGPASSVTSTTELSSGPCSRVPSPTCSVSSDTATAQCLHAPASLLPNPRAQRLLSLTDFEALAARGDVTVAESKPSPVAAVAEAIQATAEGSPEVTAVAEKVTAGKEEQMESIEEGDTDTDSGDEDDDAFGIDSKFAQVNLFDILEDEADKCRRKKGGKARGGKAGSDAMAPSRPAAVSETDAGAIEDDDSEYAAENAAKAEIVTFMKYNKAFLSAMDVRMVEAEARIARDSTEYLKTLENKAVSMSDKRLRMVTGATTEGDCVHLHLEGLVDTVGWDDLVNADAFEDSELLSNFEVFAGTHTAYMVKKLHPRREFSGKLTTAEYNAIQGRPAPSPLGSTPGGSAGRVQRTQRAPGSGAGSSAKKARRSGTPGGKSLTPVREQYVQRTPAASGSRAGQSPLVGQGTPVTPQPVVQSAMAAITKDNMDHIYVQRDELRDKGPLGCFEMEMQRENEVARGNVSALQGALVCVPRRIKSSIVRIMLDSRRDGTRLMAVLEGIKGLIRVSKLGAKELKGNWVRDLSLRFQESGNYVTCSEVARTAAVLKYAREKGEKMRKASDKAVLRKRCWRVLHAFQGHSVDNGVSATELSDLEGIKSAVKGFSIKADTRVLPSVQWKSEKERFGAKGERTMLEDSPDMKVESG